MTSERWQQVKVIFESTREATNEDRERVLGHTGDPEVVREVRLLLAAYDESHDFLENPALASPELLRAHISGVQPGTQLGSFEIARTLAEGGMGVVYEAFRSDSQFQQRVAIKVMKHWLQREGDVTRFRAERQIVADLNHPNIARLLDGGTTLGGLPYFVMEFVEGQYVDEFCAGRNLSSEERLRLFRKICDGVQYAHSRGVIHRDLKPANILVTVDGIPKLLDFGIAKVTTPGAASQRTYTGNRAATPRYASPEQLRGEAVTPASDIYSLGVVLYELLTGTHPYQTEGYAIHLVTTAICDQDPEKPSRRAGQKTWHGDLDDIVMKAIQKEPADRFQSVEEFSDAIGRYLDHLPAQVTVPLFTHQARTRMRRLALPAAGLILGLALLIVWIRHSAPESRKAPRRALAVLGFQNLSPGGDEAWIKSALMEMLTTELASNERVRLVSVEAVHQVKRDLNLAESSSYAADQLQKLRANLKVDYFLVGSYLGAGGTGPGLRLYVRIQDAKSGQIVAAASEQGTAQELPTLIYQAVDDLSRRGDWGEMAPARSHAVVLNVFSNPAAARLYAEALDHSNNFDVQRARDLLAKAVAADPRNPLAHSAYGAALSTLGYEGKALTEAKLAYEASSTLSREQRLLIEARYHAAGNDWPLALASYQSLWELFGDNPDYGLLLARTQFEAGKPKEALTTIAALRARAGTGSLDPRLDLTEARAAELQSDYSRMLRAASNAADAANRLNARSLLATAEQVRGDALYGLDRLDDALASYRISEQIDHNLGNEFGLASIFVRQGRVYWKQGDYATHQQFNQKALVLFQEIGNQSAIPAVLNNLALDLRQQGNFEGALKLMDQSIGVFRDLGDRHGVMTSLNNAGNLLRRLNRPEEARRNFEESLAIAGQLHDPIQTARSNVTLASLDLDEGNLISAGERLDRALATAAATDNLRMLVLQHMGDVKRARGDADAALRVLRESLALSTKLRAEQYSADTKLTLAEVAAEQKDLDTARRLLSESRAYYIAQKQKGELWGAELTDARIRLAAGQQAGAEQEIQDAIAGYHSVQSPARETEGYALLAEVLLAQHRPSPAREALLRGRGAFQKSHEYQQLMEFRLQMARADAALRQPAGTRELLAVLSEAESKGWSGLASRARAALALTAAP